MSGVSFVRLLFVGVICAVWCACSREVPLQRFPGPLSPVLVPAVAGEITGQFAPDRPVYSAFEPILVRFTVANPSDTVFEFHDGGAYRFAEGRDENIHVHITGPDGIDVPLHLGCHGGLMGVRRIQPGERYEREFVLNSWADLQEPGRYVVTMRRLLYPMVYDKQTQFPIVGLDFPPPQVALSRDVMYQRLVREAIGRHPNMTFETIAREIDWSLRVPMIESRFEIHITPFDRRVLVNRIRTLPLTPSGIVMQDGNSNAIGVLCLQLGMTQDRFSRQAAIDALEAGTVPQPREDDYRVWLTHQIENYIRWNVPKPWPLPKEPVDKLRPRLEEWYPEFDFARLPLIGFRSGLIVVGGG